MRRRPTPALAVKALLGLAFAALASAAAAQPAPRLALPIDQTARVTFAGKARDVVVGNPMIADVTVLESGGAILHGREYGATTVTAFDEAGRAIFSRQVIVVEGDTNRVAVFRGTEASNYVCAATCQRTPMPGESRAASDDDTSAYVSYANRQRQAAQGAASN